MGSKMQSMKMAFQDLSERLFYVGVKMTNFECSFVGVSAESESN